ncbi:MAG: carbohydrate ABC transporter permease [Acutalibacteraceae bacterium]|nr:sugar ABC transporter permease [Clostridiales bacterium]
MRKQPGAALKSKKPWTFSRFIGEFGGWVFIIPSFILFAFFVWEPMLYGVVLSFSKLRAFDIVGFAGLENYRYVFSHPYFAKALLNTVQYAFWSLIIGYLVPIIVAIILNEVVHAQRFFKFVAYFPALVPAVAALLMWQFLLTPGQEGIINSILSQLGIAPLQFLQNPNWTIPLLIMTLTWKSAGSTTMVYLASLQGINGELYEAASLDGAGVWSKLRYITLPGIFNTARLMLIMQIISIFQILYEPMVMTGGGPNNASISLMYLSYQFAFDKIQFNYAAVVGIVVSVILLILTAIYMKLVKPQES